MKWLKRREVGFSTDIAAFLVLMAIARLDVWKWGKLCNSLKQLKISQMLMCCMFLCFSYHIWDSSLGFFLYAFFSVSSILSFFLCLTFFIIFYPLSTSCSLCCFSCDLSEDDAYVDKLPTFERHFDSLAGIVTVPPWRGGWGFKKCVFFHFLFSEFPAGLKFHQCILPRMHWGYNCAGYY